MRQTSRDAALRGNRRGKAGIGLKLALFLTMLMLPSAARAQKGGDYPRGQEARHVRMAACSYKSAGTTCSFSEGNQTFSGTCEATQNAQLACRNAVSKQGLNQSDDSFDQSDDSFHSGMDAGDIPQ